VAILGISGIGKSTTLAVLALMALGEVTFESLESLSLQAAEEEEQGLSELERTQRARERQQIAERAQAKIDQTRRLKEEQLLKVQEQLPTLEIKGPARSRTSGDLDLDPAALGASTAIWMRGTWCVPSSVMCTVTSQVVCSVISALERRDAGPDRQLR
jgi:hypothetical protein